MRLKHIFLVFIFKQILEVDVTSKKNIKRRSMTRSKYNRDRILWNKKIITYSLFGDFVSNNQTTLYAIKKALNESFSEWEANSCFKFKNVTPNYVSDIKIIFTNDRMRYSPRRVEDPFSLNYTHHNCER